MSPLEPISPCSMPVPTEQRNEDRHSSSLRFTPVNCTLVVGNQKIAIEVVNYHYRGACLRTSIGDYRFQNENAYLLLNIGEAEISKRIYFRILWESVSKNGTLGVEFVPRHARTLPRPERFAVHSINAPVISSVDPLDPNRTIFFKAINASTTGMLLSTSLTNKHIFPGIDIRAATLHIPGFGNADIDLVIENTRTGDKNTVLLGVSVTGHTTPAYRQLISKYLCALGDGNKKADDRIERLARSGLISKQLKNGLSIREVKTEQEYVEVLHLRFKGYSQAGKTKTGATFLDMGEGLEKEGVILGAYIAGQIVASAELRFSNKHILRISEHVDFQAHPYLAKTQFIEGNKIVISPTAQKSDVVVGMFQKIYALAILNGKLDGLVVAEDKLVPLYERVGAKKIGVSYPHPVKQSISLHVMCIPRATYENALNINPFAWSQLFGLTHDFLAKAGQTQKKEFTLWQKILIRSTKLYLNLKKRIHNNQNAHAATKLSPAPFSDRTAREVRQISYRYFKKSHPVQHINR